MVQWVAVLLSAGGAALLVIVPSESAEGQGVSNIPPSASAPASQPAQAPPADETRPDGTVGKPWPSERLDEWLTPPPEGQPQPKLVYDTLEADAGDVWMGSDGAVRWNISNVGDAPLHLDVGLTCCTALRSGPRRRTVAPGATTTYDLLVDKRARGPHRMERHVLVRTNDRDHLEIRLTVSVNVLCAVLLDGNYPGGVQFGDVKRDSGPLTKTITITRGDGGPLKPRVLAASISEYTLKNAGEVKLSEPEANLREVKAGKEYELSLTIRPPWPTGAINGEVRLATGFGPQPECKVSFSARMQPRLKLVHQSVAVARVRSEPVSWSAELEWSSESPAGKIASVKAPDGVTAAVEERQGRQVLVVQFSPEYPAPPKGKFAVVWLTTDDPLVPKLRANVPFQP